MIDTKALYNAFYNLGLDFYVGVQDISLKDFEACITSSQSSHALTHQETNIQNISAPNSKSAVSIAIGYHIATNKCPVVYVPSTQLGGIIDSLNSTVNEKTFTMPLLIVVCIRGLSEKEAEYHRKGGTNTEKILMAMKEKCFIVNSNTEFSQTISDAYHCTIKEKKPAILLIDSASLHHFGATEKKRTASLNKYDALRYILKLLNEKDFVVSSSGNVAKEIYEIRTKNKQSHDHDLLLASAYGQTTSVAYGLAINSKNNVWCIDGDGTFLSHLSEVANSLLNTQRNMKYILIDDECQSSAGGQKSHSSNVDIKKMLKSMGMKNTMEAYTYEDIKIGILRLEKEKSALIIKVSPEKPFKIENDDFNAKNNFEKFKEEFQKV